ncbi:MAG: adenylate/guanylate cyclase domain-containing protein [Polyangiaceae bacterium]
MPGGWFRDLLRPAQPEPISIEQWRRGERAIVLLAPPLAILNVLTRFLFARDPATDVHAYDAFLAVNLPAHAVAIVAASWGLLRAKDEHGHRMASTIALFFGLVTAVPGIWLLGSVDANLNIVFALVVIAVVRVSYDAALGAFMLATAVVLHASIIGLEAARVLPSKPLFVKAPHVVSGVFLAVGVAWVSATYLLVWALSSYVANRIRSTEHALRTLNVGLETRVREQVTALERAHRLRRYVAPQLADEILRSEADVTLLRERRPITVMFADLRGFTPMVESVEPDVLASILNRYFDEVAKIAFSHGGTIDKFIGDAIMVFFGAPEATGERDQAVRCVAMAIEIQRRVRELGDEFLRLGAGAPLEVRIGIGSGTATVGSFGASHRSDYTVVGAPVNRAARLEPLAPVGEVLIDEATRDLVEGAFEMEARGEVPLKGFAKPARTFRVIATGKLVVPPVHGKTR